MILFGMGALLILPIQKITSVIIFMIIKMIKIQNKILLYFIFFIYRN